MTLDANRLAGAKIVSGHILFKRALIEAQVVMFLVCVGLHLGRDHAPDKGWVTLVIIILLRRRLEVVIDHTALLLFAQCEVVRLELGFQLQVCFFLCELGSRTLVLRDKRRRRLG